MKYIISITVFLYSFTAFSTPKCWLEVGWHKIGGVNQLVSSVVVEGEYVYSSGEFRFAAAELNKMMKNRSCTLKVSSLLRECDLEFLRQPGRTPGWFVTITSPNGDKKYGYGSEVREYAENARTEYIGGLLCQ